MSLVALQRRRVDEEEQDVALALRELILTESNTAMLDLAKKVRCFNLELENLERIETQTISMLQWGDSEGKSA